MASYLLVDVGRPTGQWQWADRLFVVALGMVAATTMEPIPGCQRRQSRRRKKRTLPSLSLTNCMCFGCRRKKTAPCAAALLSTVTCCTTHIHKSVFKLLNWV